MATLERAIGQMLDAGMPPFPGGAPVVDGKVHRYGKGRRAWYVLHEFRGHSASFIAGAFGIWGQLDSTKITRDFTGIDAEERDRLQRAQREQELRELAKRAARARAAALRGRRQWHAARAHVPEGGCAYLVRKQITPEKGMRFFTDGTLIVPMLRYDVTDEQDQDLSRAGPRRLVGVQKIAPDGMKRFNKYAWVDGAATRFGKEPKPPTPLIITEGVATARSIRMALGDKAPAVFVAYNAGNLLPAARILRQLYPWAKILFAADDDAYLVAQLNKRLQEDFHAAELVALDREREAAMPGLPYAIPGKDGMLEVSMEFHQDANGVEGLTCAFKHRDRLHTLGFSNAGRTKANAAAAEIGSAWVCFPRFTGRELGPDPDSPRLTDFNDLHVAEGLDVVREQLLVAIAAMGETPSVAPAAKRTDDKDDPDDQRLKELLARYTLIYPSDEAFDHNIEELVKLEHIRNAYGRKPVSRWQASGRRRTVLRENVIFDPTEEASRRRDVVNLFRGWPLKPSAEDQCRRLLELLQFLCGEADRDDAPITHWVLRWLALPLQRPGTKMATAIVMYGGEGTGKNLFFSAVRRIYGVHGGFITQRQLESDFNPWLSAKLFLVANEVVTRHEMSHHVGYLKHLITEPEVYINVKNMNERLERNFANIVFLSNELQPLKIGIDDRRYMVIRTPSRLAKQIYEEIAAEADNGGIEALYHYLLHDVDLGDFHAHSEPPFTDAKRELVQIGLSSAQLFWQDLHDGDLGLPYVPALREDVFDCYVAWCKRNGEKMPMRINRFIPEFRSMNGVEPMRIPVPNPDIKLAGEQQQGDKAKTRRRVFVMGAPAPKHVEFEEYVGAAVRKFRAATKEFVKRGEP